MGKLFIHYLVGSAAAGLASAAALERRAPAVALAENTLQLSRQIVDRPEGGRLRPWHRRLNQVVQYAEPATDAEADPIAVGTGFVRAEQNQIEYLTDVKAGNQTFSLIVDTGSSDTWIVSEKFKCTNDPIREPPCLFGKKFAGEFPGGKISNQHLMIQYGYEGGPNMRGEFGYSE
jgi:hypothetical protein